jgi:hypothetical protein
VLTTVSQALIKNIVNYGPGVDMPRDGDGILAELGLFSPSYWLQSQQQQQNVLQEQASSSNSLLDLQSMLSAKKGSKKEKATNFRRFSVDHHSEDAAHILAVSVFICDGTTCVRCVNLYLLWVQYGGGIEDLSSLRASMPAIEGGNAVFWSVLLFLSGTVVFALYFYFRKHRRSHHHRGWIKKAITSVNATSTTLYEGLVACVDWLDLNIFHFKLLEGNPSRPPTVAGAEIGSGGIVPGVNILHPAGKATWLSRIMTRFGSPTAPSIGVDAATSKVGPRSETSPRSIVAQVVPNGRDESRPTEVVSAAKQTTSQDQSASVTTTLPGLLPSHGLSTGEIASDGAGRQPKAVKFSVDPSSTAALSANVGSTSGPGSATPKQTQSSTTDKKTSKGKAKQAGAAGTTTPAAAQTSAVVKAPAATPVAAVPAILQNPQPLPQPKAQPTTQTTKQASKSQIAPTPVSSQNSKSLAPQAESVVAQKPAVVTPTKPSLEVYKAPKPQTTGRASSEPSAPESKKTKKSSQLEPSVATSNHNVVAEGSSYTAVAVETSPSSSTSEITAPDEEFLTSNVDTVKQRGTSTDLDETMASTVDWLVSESSPDHAHAADPSFQYSSFDSEFASTFTYGGSFLGIFDGTNKFSSDSPDSNDYSSASVTPPPGLRLSPASSSNALPSLFPSKSIPRSSDSSRVASIAGIALLTDPDSTVTHESVPSYSKPHSSDDDLDLSSLIGMSFADDISSVNTSYGMTQSGLGLGFSFSNGAASLNAAGLVDLSDRSYIAPGMPAVVTPKTESALKKGKGLHGAGAPRIAYTPWTSTTSATLQSLQAAGASTSTPASLASSTATTPAATNPSTSALGSFEADQYFQLSADAPEFSPSFDYSKMSLPTGKSGLPSSAPASSVASVVASTTAPATGLTGKQSQQQSVSVAYAPPNRSASSRRAALQGGSPKSQSKNSYTSPPLSGVFDASAFPPLPSLSLSSSSANSSADDLTVPPFLSLGLSITVCCTIIHHSQTKSLQLTSNLLSNWNNASAVVMVRSTINPSLWTATLTVQVPIISNNTKVLSFGNVEYRYMTTTSTGQLVTETGAHSIDMDAAYASFQRKLQKKKSAGIVVTDEWTMRLEVEDTFDRGVMVKT